MTEVEELEKTEEACFKIYEFLDTLPFEIADLLRGYVSDAYASLDNPICDESQTGIILIESVYNNNTYETHEYIKLVATPGDWKLSIGSYQEPHKKVGKKSEVHEVVYNMGPTIIGSDFPVYCTIHDCNTTNEYSGLKQIMEKSEIYTANLTHKMFVGDCAVEKKKVYDEKGVLIKEWEPKTYRICDKIIPFHTKRRVR